MMKKMGLDLEYLVRGSIDRVVVIGPLLCRPGVNGWYFIVATAGKRGFRCDQICTGTEDYQQASMDQAQIITLLVQKKKGLVMHLMDDELAMAQLCETLWPSARTTCLRQTVESERAAFVRHQREGAVADAFRRADGIAADCFPTRHPLALRWRHGGLGVNTNTAEL